MRRCVSSVRRSCRVTKVPRLNGNRPPHIVAHSGDFWPVAGPIHHVWLPLGPLFSVLLFDHARTIVTAAAAGIGGCELGLVDFAVLHHLIKFFGQELENVPASFFAAQMRAGAEDVVEDAVNAIGVESKGVPEDFHEEIDRSVIMVACSGVPSPGCEGWLVVQGYATLAYDEAGFDDAIDRQ